MKRLVLVSALLVFLIPWAWAQQRGVELLPLTNEIPGWVWVDTPEVALDSVALYGWIDGAGVVFVRHGFVEAWRQIYMGLVPSGQDSIHHAWTFDQGTPDSARNTYHDPRSGSGDPWIDPGHAGEEARIDSSGLWDYRIDFWQGKFFCWVEYRGDHSDTALAIAKRFAKVMSDKIVGVEQGSAGTKPNVPFGFTSVRRNPSRGGCTVEFSLSAPSWARVSVYDAQGRFLRELVQGTLSTGKHRLYWDGKDGNGLPTGSGVYFLRLVTEERSASAKLVVVR